MNAAIALTSVMLFMHSSSALASQPSTTRSLAEQFLTSTGNANGEAEFVVRTTSAAPRPCLAVPSMDKEIAILVSKELVEKLAVKANKHHYKGEIERQEVVFAARAKELLGSVTNARTRHGCNKTSTNAETRYLIGRLLDSGQVAIYDDRKRQFVPSFTVSFSSAKGIGGMAAYRVQDTAIAFRTFFAYQLWVH